MLRIFTLILILLNTPISHAQSFKKVLEPKKFQIPRSYGAHKDYPTEWWYFTGHLSDKENTYGFELTFFRVGVEPGDEENKKNWEAKHLYISHFALTDDNNQKFYHDEKIERGSFEKLAGSKDQN